MKKVVLLCVCLTVISLQSCTKQDLNEDQQTTDVYQVERDKIVRPGNQSGG